MSVGVVVCSGFSAYTTQVDQYYRIKEAYINKEEVRTRMLRVRNRRSIQIFSTGLMLSFLAIYAATNFLNSKTPPYKMKKKQFDFSVQPFEEENCFRIEFKKVRQHL